MFQYENRRGVTYYLHRHAGRGTTVRYTLKRTSEGAQAQLPPGYEVMENVNGQASVRRTHPRQITAEKEAVVQSGLAQHELDAYRIEVKDQHITVFEPDSDTAEIAARFSPLAREVLRRQLDETTRYSPVLRFGLVDPKRRLFLVSRMSYRGDGGWHRLAVMPLVEAVKRHMRHLGKESFFDLI